MSAAVKCPEELDFRLSFEEEEEQKREEEYGSGGHSTGHVPLSQSVSQDQLNPPPYFSTTDGYQHVLYQPQGSQHGTQGNLRTFDCPSIQITSIAPNHHVEPCVGPEDLAVGGANGGYSETSWSRDQLYLPLDPCYRDPVLCPSPCSSMSSRSWMSDLSSCESFSHVHDDVEADLVDAAAAVAAAGRPPVGSPLGSPFGSPGCGGGAFGVELWQQKYQHPGAFSPSLSPLQSPRQSPCHSPRTSITEENWLNRRPTSRPSSRPTSPCGKRRSPSPTPSVSPRDSVTEDNWAGTGSPAGIFSSLLMSNSYQELDVPSKTRRTSGSQLVHLPGQGQGDLVLGHPQDPCEGQDQDGLAELFLQVPSHFSWNKPTPGNPPLFRPSSPPPLDWPLPSQHSQYELRLEVQPKPYHRAHYETEGSRGSIKAASGGHPIVKLIGYTDRPVSMLSFIGTADDRYLRPHSFYQVHRVTGKTVTTSCQEKVLGFTKVLEIPLLPENNMCASIDCAGILKLRNTDIELKKGETDIGRKNTRVRVVFRAAVPQPDAHMLWLQTVSIPVECSQRSGQELPQVESFSPNCCSVDGGEELTITGSNICSQSTVVFMEKGPDGRSLWELEATVVSERSSGSSVTVEVPPFYKKTSAPVQVHFYVSNGKRRRSVVQNFTYLPRPGAPRPAAPAAGPPLIKQEHWNLDHVSYHPPGLGPDLPCYPSCDPPGHSQGRPFHKPPCLLPPPLPSSAPLQNSPLFPQPSSFSSTPSQTSILSAQSFSLPPQMSTLSPPAPSVPHQSFTTLPYTSSLSPSGSPTGLRRAHPASAYVTSTQLHDEPVLNIKEEQQEQPSLRSLGLQEITLDDVNEIIDRDIGSPRSDHSDQYQQYQQSDWEHRSTGAAATYCGGAPQ